jgi:periplasmic protein TonB
VWNSMVTTISGEFITVLVKGGFIMIPLLGDSLISVAVIIERLYFWRKLRAQEIDGTILPLVAEGDLKQALHVASTSQHPVACGEPAGIPSAAGAHYPPRIIEKPLPKRVEPRPKPIPPPKPARSKKLAPDVRDQAEPGPRDASVAGASGGSKPGPRLPLPDDTQQVGAGNVLGPPSPQKAEDRPPAPVEGGEAGAGNLFDRGDVGVIPGSSVGGGSGAGGRGGLGLGAAGGGARVGGIRAGSGGEGSGEGGGSTSLPTGGYQVKPRYPDSARRQGIEGTVVVKAYVTEQGGVEQVQVEQSAGHPDLDQAAVEAVGRWRFEPARRGRRPTAMWVSIPVKFVLNR